MIVVIYTPASSVYRRVSLTPQSSLPLALSDLKRKQKSFFWVCQKLFYLFQIRLLQYNCLIWPWSLSCYVGFFSFSIFVACSFFVAETQSFVLTVSHSLDSADSLPKCQSTRTTLKPSNPCKMVVRSRELVRFRFILLTRIVQIMCSTSSIRKHIIISE